MKQGGVEKSDTGLPDTIGNLRRGQVDRDAEGFEHICAAALAGDAAVAVFGNAEARAGGHESGRGRNVKRVAGVAARAAGIEQRLFTLINLDGLTDFPDGGGESDKLSYGFALTAKKGQHIGDLFRGHCARKHPLHEIVGFRLGQVNKIPERQVRHASAIHSITRR